MREISHDELWQLIDVAYNKKVSLFVWGTFGIGKSSVVQDYAKDNKLEFLDIRISQLEPSDLRGLPSLNNGETKWLPPSWLPKKT